MNCRGLTTVTSMTVSLPPRQFRDEYNCQPRDKSPVFLCWSQTTLDCVALDVEAIPEMVISTDTSFGFRNFAATLRFEEKNKMPWKSKGKLYLNLLKFLF